MINIYEVLETNKMIEQENLDVRTITMGISLLDCADTDVDIARRGIVGALLPSHQVCLATLMSEWLASSAYHTWAEDCIRTLKTNRGGNSHPLADGKDRTEGDGEKGRGFDRFYREGGRIL